MPDNVTPIHRLCEQALAKLAASGITPAQAAEMGMYSVDDASKLHKTFAPIRALVIPYKPELGLSGFYRIRYLEPPPRSFKQKPLGKYSQPPNSGVEAYFTPNINWATVVNNISIDIVFTEGELKAAAACMRDIAAIGLGGVYNFKTKDTSFLPELDACDWQDRNVRIAYDSDAKTNPHVYMAMGRLTDELRERGAAVTIIDLPHGPRRAKQGLDDYLLAHSDEEWAELVENARDPDPPEFFDLNEEVCYVEEIDRYVAIDDDGPPMTFTTFTRTSDYASRQYKVPTSNGRGEIVFKDVYVTPAWTLWPRRHARKAVVYEPGQPRLLDVGLNRWPGWGCESIEGDAGPFLELVEFVFEGVKKDHVEWFLDWCAYPMQNPGAKLAQAVLVHGVATGTGKTLIGQIIGDIYGENFSSVTAAELHSQFNGWAHNKQFVLGDEVSGSDKRSESDQMKSRITQERVTINIKNQPTYSITDCINYYFTSNHPDAMFLEAFDRRFFIVDVVHDFAQGASFYRHVMNWRRNGGPSALRHWFENRRIDSEFNPGGHAPMTAAREAMIYDSASDLGLWCLELKENFESMLVVGKNKLKRDLFTAEELLTIYWSSGRDPNRYTKANAMTRALKAAGFKLVYGGEGVRIDTVRSKYFAIRDAKRWLNTKGIPKVEPWLRANIMLDR